jgi:hypothetical protein
MLGKQYKFIVPWESRGQIDVSSYSNASYDRADYISFPQGLTVLDITEKVKLPYITYITDFSATVNSSFTDKSKVQNDFGNISIVFPDSILVINTHESVDLPYNSTVFNSYMISLPKTISGYSLSGESFNITSTKDFSVNDSVNITIVGKGIGDKIVKIDSISVN